MRLMAFGVDSTPPQNEHVDGGKKGTLEGEIGIHQFSAT